MNPSVLWIYVQWFQPEGEAESWRPLKGVERIHPRSSHTCCLHLYHRGAEQPQQTKHNRKSPTDPDIFPVDIQAKPDVLPLSPSPSCSLLLWPSYPHCCLLFHLLLPSAFPSALSLPQGGWVTESLGPLSHGGGSFNKLHMCSDLIGWPSAISPDLQANHRVSSLGRPVITTY